MRCAVVAAVEGHNTETTTVMFAASKKAAMRSYSKRTTMRAAPG